jgi:hypothetical protein
MRVVYMRVMRSIQVWIFAAICGTLWYFHQEMIAVALIAGHVALNGQGVDAFGLDSLEELRRLREEVESLRNGAPRRDSATGSI